MQVPLLPPSQTPACTPPQRPLTSLRLHARNPPLPQGPLFLIHGKFLKAGLAFRGSLLAFEHLRAAAPDPPLHAAAASYRDWGIGLFQLFLANAPQSILAVLELVAGLRGDMAEARQRLQQCVDGAGPAARWAAVVLAMDRVNSAACGFDPDVAVASLEAASRVIEEQRARLPGSALLKWMHAVVVLRQGDMGAALAMMDEVKAQVAPELEKRGVPGYRLALEVGLIHFASRDLDTAVACWEPLADPSASYTARALSAVLLGTALSMRGDRARAEEVWSRVPSLAQGGQYDGSLAKKVGVFARRSEPGLAGIELMYIRGTMPVSRGKDPARLEGMQKELQGVLLGRRRCFAAAFGEDPAFPSRAAAPAPHDCLAHQRLCRAACKLPRRRLPPPNPAAMLERCTRRVAGGKTPASRPASPFVHSPDAAAPADFAAEGVPGGLPLGDMTPAERFEEELSVRLYLGIVKRIMARATTRLLPSAFTVHPLSFAIAFALAFPFLPPFSALLTRRCAVRGPALPRAGRTRRSASSRGSCATRGRTTRGRCTSRTRSTRRARCTSWRCCRSTGAGSMRRRGCCGTSGPRGAGSRSRRCCSTGSRRRGTTCSSS